MAAGDNELRISARAHPARQPRRQVSKDFRGRGDAGREEGRAYRQNFQLRGRAQWALALRPPPSRDPLLSSRSPRRRATIIAMGIMGRVARRSFTAALSQNRT